MANLVTPNGHTMDYLDGDPGGLAGEVTRLKNVASTIDMLTDLLGKIKDGSSSQTSRTDDIKEAAGETRNSLSEARGIYNDTGWALDEYQTQLSTSVSNAKSAYDSASAYLSLVNSAEDAVSTAQNKYNGLLNGSPTPDPALTPEQQAAQNRSDIDTAREELTAAQNLLTTRAETLNGYKTTWDTAKDDLDKAADTARGRIDKAAEESPAKDSRLDNLFGFLDALADVLGWIILVLVIVALFVAAPIALALIAIATVLTVVNLVIHSLQAIFRGGSWLDVGLDLVGLIPFGKLVTSGGSVGARLLATLNGTIDGLRLPTLLRAPKLVNAAVAQNAISGSGRFWQSWADDAAAVVAGADGSILTALGMNGSRTQAQLLEILDGLNPRNVDAREAIALAREAVGSSSTADGVHFVASQAASDVKLGLDVAGGDDWVVSSISDWVSGPPSTDDLKARVMEPDLVSAPAATENPYPYEE